MATSVDQQEILRRNHYVGEISSQLRHGYGVYYYGNTFFRYEGEWNRGKKHGHGKLLMADGSYYEGDFKEGEIDGHGFRKWVHNGNTYSGEFRRGEMYGTGVMNYGDGSQYQGEMCDNMRQGEGVFCDTQGNEYEGSWYHNRKHGKGVQLYSNEDQYDGDWIDGKRHGHGELSCVDGTVYDGQWRGDLMNGQGVMNHSSGVTYSGVWLNGRPLVEANHVMVKFRQGKKHVEVKEGKKFRVRLQIVDRDGNPTTGESGREFRIRVGYRCPFKKTKHKNSILELIEELETEQIETKFGYEVLTYPLMQIKEADESFDEVSSSCGGSPRPSVCDDALPRLDDVIAVSNVSVTKVTDEPEHHDDDVMSITDDAEAATLLSGDPTVMMEETHEHPRLPPPPQNQRSSYDGTFIFQHLAIPDPPSTFRSILHEAELMEKNKKPKMSRNMSGSSQSSHGMEQKKTKGSFATNPDSDKSAADSKKKRGGGSALPKQTAKKEKGGKKPEKKASVISEIQRTSHVTETSLPTPHVVTSELVERFKRFILKIVKRSEYVLIIDEVTDPPFLGSRLPTTFALAKVYKQRRNSTQHRPSK